MAKKKTEKTDTPETEVNADTASAAEQLIIDVTPERVASGKGASYAALILALFGVGLGGFATYHALKSAQGFAPAYPSQAEQLNEALHDIEERISSDIGAVQTQLDALFEQMDALESAADRTISSSIEGNGDANVALSDMRDSITQLQAQFTSLTEKQQETAKNTGGELSLEAAETLLIKLRYERATDALQSARKQDAAAMRGLIHSLTTLDAENQPLIAAIFAFTPTIDALYTQHAIQTHFAQAADEALAIRVEGEGWWQQQVNQLAKLVKVRKVNADENSIAAKIEAAQAALNRGDTSDAIDAIQRLPAPASDYFKAWLPKAQSYHQASQTYQTLLNALQNSASDVADQAASDVSNTPSTNVTIQRPTVSVDYDTVPAISPAEPIKTLTPLNQAPALAEE